MLKKSFYLFIVILLVSGCAQKASWHANEIQSTDKKTMALGDVQSRINKGMSGAQVAEVLGSPNIVSTDENGNEVWIYDKFYTESVASGSNGTTFSLSNIGAGAARTSQSTMTVIIKYNAAKKVRDIAYHKSSF